MKTTLIVAATLTGTFAQVLTASANPTHSECVELGIEYYKEIGSFPKLSNGKDTLEKIIAMCSRSRVAFGEKK
jgi:hypothetical protein